MNKIFYVLFGLIFFLTGVLQFLGISITILSYSLVMIICFILISFFFIIRRITVNSYVIINLCLLLWIIVSGIVNHTNLVIIINYFSYSIIPISVYLFIKSLKFDSINIDFVINLLILIQLPILCVQYFIPEYVMKKKKVISPVDRLFGSFPLSSDHFLSFFLIMNIIYIGVKESSLTFFNYFIIVYSVICISLTNSTTSYLMLITALFYVFFIRSNLYMKICLLFMSVILLVFLYFNIYEFLIILKKPELLDMANTKFIADGTAGRAQTLFYVFINKLPIFGYGPSSYYNPLLGGFQFNLNFSQLLWFFYDLGFVGVILLISLIYSFLLSFNMSIYLRFYLFFLILVYSFSSTIFDQLSFLFTLNIFASIMQQKKLIINK